MYNKAKGYSNELDRLLHEMESGIEEINKQILKCREEKDLQLLISKRLEMSRLKSELVGMYAKCEVIKDMENMLIGR